MPEPKVYLVRAGKDGGDEAQWLEEGLAFIGFIDVPSLESAKDFDDVYKVVVATRPEAKPRANGNSAGQLWAFAVAMKEGDLVVLPRKQTSQLAIGRVAGPYRFVKVNGRFRHARKTTWRT